MNQLERSLRILVEEKKVVSGISAAYGSRDNAELLHCGNIAETEERGGALAPALRPVTEDSIYDLASITKLFTCVSLLMLMERGTLCLSDPVGKYEPRLKSIGDVTILALMSFRVGLKTRERVDAQPDKASGADMLFSVEKAPLPERRYYTDIGAMLLKYVVERASGKPFYSFIKENILIPLGMLNTYARVPREALGRTASYNFERRIVDGKYLLDRDCPPGVPHDPKARLLQGTSDDLCGHAGLFSTLEDMVRFAQGMLSCKLISRETLLTMGVNRTGIRLQDGTFSQHCGLMCFAKHPVQTYSEVPACFGAKALALSGFTGNHISFDPEQDRFMLLLSNRIHNRITVANGRPDPFDQTAKLAWEDGKTYPVSQNYVYMQDRFIKEPMARLMGLK